MIQTIQLFPGITLRCCPDTRFKHGCLSLQLVRPMCREEAPLSALLPAVLLRGSRSCPDLQRITARLDDLYGASVGALVRKVGDYHTTGLFASFLEDRFAMDGDAILEPLVLFLRELLLEPALEDGCFRADFVESEKRNLISTIESRLNSKSAYAMDKLVRSLCARDPYGIPRLGDKEAVAAITPQSLWAHYRLLLAQCPIQLFYVGSARPEAVAGLLRRVLADLPTGRQSLPPQTALRQPQCFDTAETMDVSQGKLCLGFTTPITTRDPEFPAMQLLNALLGGGITSKLFTRVREQLSLCYAISSSYTGAKGLFTVAAGIDSGNDQLVRREILAQLEDCRQGRITDRELTAARQAVANSLRTVHDSPGAMESYYATGVLSGLDLTPSAYLAAAERATVEQVRQAAQSLTLRGSYFLKGVQP